MKLILEINNQTRFRLKENYLRRVILATLKKSGCEFLSKKGVAISLAVVGPAKIRKLNQIYRQRDETTDILSFAEHKTKNLLRNNRKNDIFLGELIICPANIRRYAEKEKTEFKKELGETLAHGVLHLLGFVHGKEMFKTQKNLAKY